MVVKRLCGDCDVIVKCCIGHWCGGKNIGERWGHHRHGVGCYGGELAGLPLFTKAVSLF